MVDGRRHRRWPDSSGERCGHRVPQTGRRRGDRARPPRPWALPRHLGSLGSSIIFTRTTSSRAARRTTTRIIRISPTQLPFRGERQLPENGSAGPVHPLLKSTKQGGVIEYFPAHPHEGAVGVPEGIALLASLRRAEHGERPSFNLAVAVDGEPFDGGSWGVQS